MLDFIFHVSVYIFAHTLHRMAWWLSPKGSVTSLGAGCWLTTYHHISIRVLDDSVDSTSSRYTRAIWWQCFTLSRKVPSGQPGPSLPTAVAEDLIGRMGLDLLLWVVLGYVSVVHSREETQTYSWILILSHSCYSLVTWQLLPALSTSTQGCS